MALAATCVTCTMGAGSSETVPDYSVEWVCAERPARVRALFDALDLSRPELEAVRAAAQAGDWPSACRALLHYYRHADTAGWLRRPPAKRVLATVPRADAVLRDTLTFYSVERRLPRTRDGGIDWGGPGPDDHPEWMDTLHRHAHFRWLMDAWQRTADAKYLDTLCAHIDDWIVSNPPPDRPSDSRAWHPLPTAVRLRFWADVFFGLQGADPFAGGARVLMLSGVVDHAEYLRRHHSRGHNQQVSQMLALAKASAAWPEFDNAPEWMDYAVDEMAGVMRTQVYSDGALRELTSHYHRLVVRNVEQFVDMVSRAGRPLPPVIRDGMEAMWGYLAGTMRPDGCMLLNNDSDTRFIRGEVAAAARRYGRDDWALWAAINAGDTVAAPQSPPSRAFPWAGHLVMRDGWGPRAQWAWFDHGPAGTTHQHADALHLSLAAHGRMLLVDAGRYTYAWGKWRNYFVGTASHNTVMLDGCRQELRPLETQEADDTAVVSQAFDYGRGTLDTGYIGLDGEAAHTRAVLYVRGRYWIVVDRIDTDRPRDVEALWHFHPHCTVAAGKTSVETTDNDAGNLRITPAGNAAWTVELVSGRERPVVQGWHSPEFNVKQPATAAVYAARIDGSETFVWLLEPAPGRVAPRPVTLAGETADGVCVRVGGPDPVDAFIPVRGAAAPRISGTDRSD